MKAIIYHNPSCKLSCSVLEFLKNVDVAFNIAIETRLYIHSGVTRAEIYDILQILKVDIREIICPKQKHISQENLSMYFSIQGLMDKITANPTMLESPIILFKERNIGMVVRTEDAILPFLEFVIRKKLG